MNLGRSLQMFREQTGRLVLVSWLGGEPFQWPSLMHTSTRFQRDFGLSLSVTTNGMALRNLQTRQAALQLFQQITISIDGMQEHHDRLRLQPDMYSGLKQIVRLLQLERDRSVNLLRVNTILTKHNIASFPEFCCEMASWGFDQLTFNPLGGNDRPEFYPDNRLTAEQIIEFADRLPAIRRLCEQQGMSILGASDYLDRLLATSVGQKIPVSDCGPGNDFLFVDELGRMSPCSFTTAQLGINIENDSLCQPHEVQKRFRRLKQSRCPSACEDCHANHVFAKFV